MNPIDLFIYLENASVEELKQIQWQLSIADPIWGMVSKVLVETIERLISYKTGTFKGILNGN